MGSLDTITLGGDETVTRYRGKVKPRCLDKNSGFDREFQEWRDALSVSHSSYGPWEPNMDRA